MGQDIVQNVEIVENKKRPEILALKVIKTIFFGIRLYRRVHNQEWSITYPMYVY